MAENIKHFPVNWIEGMKINKNHFIELQENVEDVVRDARNLSINELNYGILNTPLSKPFQYSISIDTHKELSVDIKTLKAVTPSGGRIEITEYTGSYTEKIELKDLEKESNYYLLINIDPYQRIPSGEQNMEEVPPRFPNTKPKHFITTVIESEVNQNNIGPLQFPIAKLKTAAGNYEISETYIPPCLTVNGHPLLVSLFEKYDAIFKRIEFNSVQIIQKIKFRNNLEDENIISNMVHEVCDKSLRFAEQHVTQSKWMGYNSKPMSVLENIVSFARTLKNSFDVFSGDGKEMLFNYFAEWTDSKSGDFERLFTDIINIKYKSFDIEETVNQATYFITKIDNLYVILSQLDYIGRKKDTGIFVNENVLKNEKIGSSIFGNDNSTTESEKPNSSPSFLAD